MPSRRAVVTGAGSGIGAAITSQLAAQGWQVIGTARSQSGVAELQQLPNVVGVRADIRTEEGAGALADRVRALGGQLDALVNNAGILAAGTVGGSPPEVWEQAMATNFFGTLRVTRALLPALTGSQGRIVAISSVACDVTASPQGPYTASKAALEQAMQALDQELVTTGVRVTILRLGIVPTPIHRHPVGADALDPTGRRLGARLAAVVRGQLAGSPTRPADVGVAVSQLLSDPAPPLRVTLGEDAHALLRARSRATDRDWARWWATEDDAAWRAGFQERTGLAPPG
jgi:NAD(P)-dependent dehydrogenase (short-subunit alcohol dehydrogenase family)